MDPGFHRFYARRLAWRYRLLLALGLALLGLLYPSLALASPLALLLPARPFEGPALRAIARKSLAYPTALAYGEERLWQEAKKVRVEPPPFPTGLLLAYLLVLLLALAPWKLPEGERPRPGQPPAPEAPAFGKGEGSSPAGEALGPGEAPAREAGAPPSEGQGQQDGAQAPREGTGGPGKGEEGPAAKAEGRAPVGNPAPGPAGESPGGAQGKPPGEGQTPLPTLGETPSGPEAGLLSPGGEGGDGDLPAPWPGGRPPEGVRRGAEVYLERTPLPPEARELLRRYFGLEGAPAPPAP